MMNSELIFFTRKFVESTFHCVLSSVIMKRFPNALTMIELSTNQKHCNKKD